MDYDSSDSLLKSRIRYFSPGKGGKNKFWDFSRKLGSKESAMVLFVKNRDGMVSATEPGKISYYRTTPHSLVLYGSESPLEKRVYAQEKVLMMFPLEYGDSASMPFSCEGVYCGNHLLRETAQHR
jgi:hypothetical protein